MTKKKLQLVKCVASTDEIQNMVHIVRGQRVMLDYDLSRLYGVPTSALNQAV